MNEESGVKSFMTKMIRSLLKDERGQSTTEYILILSVVVMIAMKFKTMFGSTLTGMMTQLTTNLNSAMQETTP